MSIFLYYLLFVYGALMLVWFALVLVALYHMFHYGYKNFTTFFAIFLFLIVILALAYYTYILLAPVDWTAEIKIFSRPTSNPMF
ncbi:hypothetical protein COX69_02690 [Candidatus Falkowbacteria bacterium CG_4_10_14_0_2_um_filter_48_10]|uniref:Uncharacterized protein n=1 Tax=Candidatus Falkowbacteria bacterium CG23_combo_of_CG06-09_8_20_14_all_49_15 TaxID=1974572 RepID=A0A2G9ZM16_9BACT|nr:MAG: hypothetical protein COX22_00270 [Candidatus Falkowbacteria bacterium CG23_combo_of_CG06-09_8_20_14_all_49_15]PJA08302.1 MAG: hypothetical protein COX69_02690 [Candidatus Falkowbacteria bacterium CG_4_10_14_0_2_um_filter_48_10]